MLGAAYLYNIVFINNSSLTSTNNPSPIFQGDWFSNDTLTFGIVSHIKYLNQFFETNISLTILISIFIVIFWIAKKFIKLNTQLKTELIIYIFQPLERLYCSLYMKILTTGL